MSAPDDGEARPPGYSWRSALRGNVLTVGLVSLFTDFSSEMIFPLLPMFIGGLVQASRPGLSVEAAGGVAAVYLGVMGGLAEATASLLKFFSGRISDRLRRRKALVAVGYGVSTVARPLMALAGAAWQVVGLRVADRVGKGIRTSPRDALISDAVGADVRGLAFSFHRVMDHTGAILGPLAGVVVLYAMLGEVLWKGSTRVATAEQMHALRWLFAVALVPGLLAMLTVFAGVREIAPPAGDGRERHLRAGALRGLSGRFYAFAGVIFLFSLGNSSDLFLLFLAQRRLGIGLLEVIGLWVALHASKIVFSFPGGVISDRLGRRGVLVAGWVVYALVYLGFAGAAAAWHFWALIAAYGFYHGMTEGVEKAVVADFVPSARRGTAYGVYSAADGVGKLGASLMFGVFWAVIGPKVAFGVGAALAAAAAVLLAVLLSASRQGRARE